LNISTEFKEGVKEILRTAMIAVIPLLIVGFQSWSFDWKAIVVAGAIALLSGIDKWHHKKDVGVMGNGLTGI